MEEELVERPRTRQKRPRPNPVADEWDEARISALPAWTLVRTYHVVARRLNDLFAEEHLTPVQFGVLAQLAATPDLTSSQLARRVMIRPQSMGELLVGLVDRGLLVRPGGGGRGRPAPLVLTDDGRLVLSRAGRALEAFNTPSALGVSPREREVLNTALHKMITALGP